MKCFFCKGGITDGITTHVSDLGQCIVIIRNVPCLKCEQCGEVAYIGMVAHKLEMIVNDMRAAVTEIAVVNYSDKVVA